MPLRNHTVTFKVSLSAAKETATPHLMEELPTGFASPNARSFTHELNIAEGGITNKRKEKA
jgi:hypothetical protein